VSRFASAAFGFHSKRAICSTKIAHPILSEDRGRSAQQPHGAAVLQDLVGQGVQGRFGSPASPCRKRVRDGVAADVREAIDATVEDG